MNLLFDSIIWIAYIISLYFSVFLILVYVDNRKNFKEETITPKLSNFPSVSIIIPAYNEEKNIQSTIDSALKIDYPKGKIEIIAIDHGSTDNTGKIIDHYESKIKAIHIARKATDKKASAMNKGLEIAQGEFFVSLDADSQVESSTLQRMLSLYYEQNDPRLAIVTPAMKVHQPKTILQKVQWLEYIVLILIARISSKLDSLYVAPGPFSLYKTEIIKKMGGFDEKSITEDQEIAYRLQINQYKIKHCYNGYVYTTAPAKLKPFYKQRRRWYLGSIKCLYQYRSMIANKKYGDFGMMQMTKNSLGFLLAVTGIIILAYLFLEPLIQKIKVLILINFNILPYLQNFELNITFLNFLQTDFRKGFIILFLFAIGGFLFYQAHRNAKEKINTLGWLPLIPYFAFYYSIKAVTLLLSLAEFIRGRKIRW